MATSIGKRIIYRTKRELAERALGQAMGLLGNNPDRNATYFLKAVNRISGGEKQKITSDWIKGWLAEGKPGRELLARVLHTHPNVRRRYIARMLVSMFWRDAELLEQCRNKYGMNLPAVMLISPTMRCNFRCRGCYAASYERKDDMRPEVFDRVLREAEEIGINFFVVLGGEPFIYDELLPTIKKHNKSIFQIYTNASLIDKDMAKKLVQLGNIAPMVSVNGPEEYTDESRGKGAFTKVMQAMDNLREAGCIFGFSSLVTSHNTDVICSDEWMDLLISKGAIYGWLFLYMPVGDDPDVSLMPTPEQRDKIRAFMRHIRSTKPILPADFWSDGALTAGCIAGGRLYFHVNHRGDVEPCIFCHFATHNINRCSLVEALTSPFFKAIREKQPFSFNTLRPCPMIDHPSVMWNMIQQYGAKATHSGAEKMFTTFAGDMERYASRVQEIMDDVWDNEDYHDWAARWMTVCGHPMERLEDRRREYEASRNRVKLKV